MGFSLDGYLVFRPETVALFGRMFPAIVRCTRSIPVAGPGPKAWLLPRPFIIYCDEPAHLARVHDLEAQFDDCAELDALLGVPEAWSPYTARCDWGVCAILSLVDPCGVLTVSDDTHAGLIAHEHATAWRAGRFVAAAGEERDERPYRFGARDHASRETPATWCAAHLDPAFTDLFFYDGYLPRSHDREVDELPRPMPENVTVTLPDAWPAWLHDFMRAL